MRNLKKNFKYIKNYDKQNSDLHFKIKATHQEALDICLEKNLIPLIQHQYGLKLRWLHTIKHGLPNISSNFPIKYEPSSNPKDPKWIANQQEAYREITNHLKLNNSIKVVSDICIYNIYPSFITNPRAPRSAKEFNEFKLGMTFLEEISEKIFRDH